MSNILNLVGRTKEFFLDDINLHTKKLHLLDISENNIVSLVRDMRSSFGYINGNFQTFALDIDSTQYDAFMKQDEKYDYAYKLNNGRVISE